MANITYSLWLVHVEYEYNGYEYKSRKTETLML